MFCGPETSGLSRASENLGSLVSTNTLFPEGRSQISISLCNKRRKMEEKCYKLVKHVTFFKLFFAVQPMQPVK